MKRKLSLIICIVLMVSLLAACGGDAQPTATPAVTPEPTPTATPEPVKTEFSPGEVTDNVYESSYLGIKFTMPEGWIFATEEEIMEMMNLGLDAMGGELSENELALEIAKQTTIYDMVAGAPDSSANVQVALENLAVNIGGTSITEEAYAEILRPLLEQVQGMTYAVGEVSEKTLAGKTFTVLAASIPDYGVYQEYYLLRVDKYMLVITFTSRNDPASAELADCFGEA